MRRLCAAALGAILWLSSGGSVWALWQSTAGYEYGEAWAEAWVTDEAGNLISIACVFDEIDGAEIYELYVRLVEPYDQTASYAAEVPLTITAGSETFSLVGVFEAFADRLQVRVSCEGDDVMDWDWLATVIAIADRDQTPIVASFFDKSLSFSPKGGETAIASSLREMQC